MVLKFITDKFGHKIAFIGSCVVGLCGCIWVLFGCEKCDTAQYEIFPIAVLLGAGGSAMLINCLAIVANLIGSNIEGGGFVYGGMIEMTPRLRKRLLKSKMIQSSRMLLQHWPFDVAPQSVVAPKEILSKSAHQNMKSTLS